MHNNTTNTTRHLNMGPYRCTLLARYLTFRILWTLFKSVSSCHSVMKNLDYMHHKGISFPSDYIRALVELLFLLLHGYTMKMITNQNVYTYSDPLGHFYFGNMSSKMVSCMGTMEQVCVQHSCAVQTVPSFCLHSSSGCIEKPQLHLALS